MLIELNTEEGRYAFASLVEKELKDQASDEERAFLHSSEEILLAWDQVLRALETETLSQIVEQKQVIDLQKKQIVAQTPPYELQAVLRVWRQEQEYWRKQRILRLTKKLKVIRLRRKMTTLPELAAYKAARIEEKRQSKEADQERRQRLTEENRRRFEENEQQRKLHPPSPPRPIIPASYATAFRRGFIRGIGYLYALINDGVPAREAYELCADYAHTELEYWRDTYDPEKALPPPAFPRLLEVEQEKESNP